MKTVKGNILNFKTGIIGHQCNCRLVMGAGLAKQIRDKYPHVYTEYRDIMSRHNFKNRLGRCQMVVAIPPNQLFVANLFGQVDYRPRGVRHTDYNALGAALRQLQTWRSTFFPNYPVYLPIGLGSGLAGGDWSIVDGIIRDIIPDTILVRYDSGV
jgi:O-acetyl-ADP-ribose deacetylase (regulator of RNase III)